MQNIAPSPKFGQSATPAPGPAVQGGPPGAGVRGGIPGLVDRMRNRQQPGAAPPGMSSPTGDPMAAAGVPTPRPPPTAQDFQRVQAMGNQPMPSQQLMQARALRGRAM